jgi:parallel beta-helix repeat protein
LSGDGLRDAELEMTASGTPQQPITIVADGATMRGLRVKADHVVIEGLTLRDGDGLTMTGRGLIVRNNVIYNATKDGLACIGCVDSLIESNTVQRADGTGIYLIGEQVTVRNNTVSESVLRTLGDADGIRFFGTGHRLTGNTIKDIKASGYRDEGPHTDCFQTFNTASDPPTYDVLIADNVCENVDVQCLIATAKEGGALGAPAGRTTITFEHNTCSVNGSQAVLLENFPHVVVRENTFSGPGSRAVQLNRGSTDCAVIGNTVTGRMRPFEIDRQSRPGFQEAGNTSR